MRAGFAAVLCMALIAAGCVGVEQPKSPSGINQVPGSVVSPDSPDYTPTNAAQDHAAKTYHNTANVTYSDFSYMIKNANETVIQIAIRFKRVLNAPGYTLNMDMQQDVNVEKIGGKWKITDTPNPKILSEGYEYTK